VNMNDSLGKNQRFARNLSLTAVCLALNVGLGKVSSILSLPFSMDTIGTIIGAFILPWYYLLFTAAMSSVVASVMINPIYIYYIGTQLVLGLVALPLVKANMFSKLYKAIVSGFVLGIVSAIVSAPVTALVFGGISVPSITALNALFLASGKSLWESVIRGSLIVESIDKVVGGIFVWFIARRLRLDR
jgi:energy-coupling factor transport system substrate-specific component